MKRLFLAAMLCLSATPISSAKAQGPVQLRFTGQTLADQILLKDILQNILLFGHAKFNCNSIELVEAEILDPSFDPSFDPSRTIGENSSAQKSYERWQATLCDQKEMFLISHWPASQGGTDFAITYPFPEKPMQSRVRTQ